MSYARRAALAIVTAVFPFLGCGDASDHVATKPRGQGFGLIGPHAVAREDTSDLVYFFPEDLEAQARWPAVVWFNGASGYTETWNYNELLRSLASYGFVVVGGKSLGRNPPEKDERAALLARNDEPGDRLGGRVDVERMGLAGHSLGGFQTAAAAAPYRAAAAIEGASTPSDPTPTLYLTAAMDDVVSPSLVADAFAQAFGPAWFASHGAANHDAPRLDGGPFREPFIAFFRWRLADDPSGESWFSGPECVLCVSGAWEFTAKP
jgi:dienelactone hydrolase